MTEDRSDEGFSSDDLLKEAKTQFGLDDGSSGIAASELESSMTSEDLIEKMPSIEEIAAELAAAQESSGAEVTEPAPERDVTRSSEDLIGDTSGPAAPAEREKYTTPYESPSVRVAIPDPGIPTGLPGRTVEVDSDQFLAGLPAPPEVTAPAGGLLSKLWRNRWIVIVAVIGVSILAGILDSSESISDTEVGECFDNPSGDEVSEIDPIDCADSHELEVFATITLGGVTYPGDFAIAEQAFESCLDLFEGYVGQPYATSSFYAFPFTPTESSWEDGDRGGLCVVYEPVPGTEGEEIMSRRGSVRGSGL